MATYCGRLQRGAQSRQILHLLVLVSVLLTISGARAAVNILFLNSYHEGYQWSDGVVDGVRTQFTEAHRTVELHVEYLDSKRHPGARNLIAVRRLLEDKYSPTYFKAVIASDDAAYHFMLEYGDELFPGIPFVFCGVSDFNFADIEGKKNITGVVESADFGATIDVMLSLFPGTSRIAVIHDDTPTAHGYRKSLERQLAWLRLLYPQLRVSYLSGGDLTNEELLQRVRKLRRGTIALITRWSRDREGEFVTDQHFIPRLSNVCAVPLCGTIDVQTGIVGGKLISAEKQGRTAAKMALQTLHNVYPAAIPVQMRSANVYIFDYEQLRRWGADPALLPVGSSLKNRPDSFYEQYRRYIWGGSVFIVIETIIIVLLAVNMTLRRRLEKQRLEWERRMEEARKLEGLGVLAGGIAHDFNNILTVIMGNADLLAGQGGVGGEVQASMRDIVDAARQGEKLAREMLAYSGRAHFSTSLFSLNESVSQTVAIVRREFPGGVPIEMDLCSSTGEIVGDGAQIKRATFNLLTNAMEATTKPAGSVKVTTSRVECSEYMLSRLWLGNGRSAGTYVTLRISDMGEGMVPGSLRKMFDPFYSTKFTGRGLGLAAVYGIVRRHLGCIDARSHPGQGTSVTIYLPVGGDGGGSGENRAT